MHIGDSSIASAKAASFFPNAFRIGYEDTSVVGGCSATLAKLAKDKTNSNSQSVPEDAKDETT